MFVRKGVGQVRFKVMRSNYDKAWRCPDWSGPAFRGGKGDCPGGSFGRRWSWTDHPEWRLMRCTKCGTYVLPNVLKWLDPSWILYQIRWSIRDWKYVRQWRRRRYTR
jgi:hypothetical protein